MSGETAIEWTDRTWNPLTGCTKVSPGCDHCYAKTMHERFNGPGSFDTVTLHPERLRQPLSWRKPARVFVNSMSDLFHQDVPDEFIAEAWAVMSLTPQHTYQILTKRHARMRSLTASFLFRIMVNAARMRRGYEVLPDSPPRGPSWPLHNVWLGVSVESQQWADIRIPALLDTPAAVRFLSCEPLLGPVHIAPWLTRLHECDTCQGSGSVDVPGGGMQCPDCGYDARLGREGIDWVIVGGESGHGARPMNVDWARSLRDQCTAAGVAFLFKQWGAWLPLLTPQIDGTEQAYSRLGKKAAGRRLDGRTWDEYPAA